MKMTWQFLVNQFLVATRKSYKKALKLSNYHDAYLKKVMYENQGDPDWAILYNLWKNAGNRKFVLFVETLLRRELT